MTSLSTKSKIMAEYDEKIIKLVEFLSEKEVPLIKPVISFDENRLTYPQLSQIGDNVFVSSLLEKLASKPFEILERETGEKLLVCPEHPQYLASSLRLYCPHCLSEDIKKLHLLEHLPCGKIFEDTNLRESWNGVRCEFCKQTITNHHKEIKKHGRWYRCKKCESDFDNALNKMHCRKFEHDFDFNDAITITIPTYKLNVGAKLYELYKLPIISQIKKMLLEVGFTSEEFITIKGSSGKEHGTSLYAYNDKGKTLIMDVAISEKNIDDNIVNSTIVKFLDVSPTMYILIGLPSVAKETKTIAEGHGIHVVTGDSFFEIYEKTAHVLKGLL